MEETYNDLILRDGRTGPFCLGFYLLAVLNVRIMWRQGLRSFRALWSDLRPDLVVSVLPLINHLMIQSLEAHETGNAPFAVLITDWQEMAPAVWFPRHDRYFAICGTEESYQQVVRKGHPPEKTVRTTGLLIRPSFLEPPPADRARALTELGLHPAIPVACMLYGGNGSRRMLELAESLLPTPPHIQVIFLCGRDARLAETLRTRSWPFPTLVEGFTSAVHAYLGVSDIFIGKPGPASVSEAHALGVPLLLDREPMLPQERPILRWVDRAGVGGSFKTVDEFRQALERLCAQSASRPRFEGAAIGRNQAAHEIADVIAALSGVGPAPKASSKGFSV